MFGIQVVSVLIQALILIIIILPWTRLIWNISLLFLQAVADLSLMGLLVAPLAKENLLFTALYNISKACKCIKTWLGPPFSLLFLLLSKRPHMLDFFVSLLTDAKAVAFVVLFVGFEVAGDGVLSRWRFFSLSPTNFLLWGFFADSKARSLFLVQSRHAHWGG